ncbi:BLUF domain-containing protein [Octadecabacter antarcticus]|uniref:BLUF domain-containing protein n=1 Tax=Octadecabacter antarcticus TaxID=1217908 RepID=UPI0006882404|nr:BLUF domain-containing protein [Octadecabacter antarcticus]
MSKLSQLIYLSHIQDDTTANDIIPILEISRYNNYRDNVSGLLIHGEHIFLQALEGSCDAVTRCYARICSDARHGSPYIVWQGVLEKRLFPNWSMGYCTSYDLNDDDNQALLALTNLIANEVKNVGSDLLISVLARVFFEGPKEGVEVISKR